MADWIIGHMPEHTTYLEPFFGSGAIFFNKSRAKLETVNDLDGNIVNLFQMIRDKRDELIESVFFTPYSREEYDLSFEPADNELEQARRFLVRCWMARWVKTDRKTDWRHVIDWDARPLSPAVEWTKLPDKINFVASRLQGVQVEKQPATKIIKRYSKENVLIYADPPYLLDTRRGKMYKHEMTDDDHVELLELLKQHPGPVLLSGYAHPIYDELLSDWSREERRAQAEAGQIRNEILWINPVATKYGFHQESLFS